MPEQLDTAIEFRAFFTNSTEGATGLTVTVDVYNEAGTKVVTDGSATEIGGGVYSYTLSSSATDDAGNYTCIFKTAGTVDFSHLAGNEIVGQSWVENLDAAISSRLASGSYSAPPSAASIATEVWSAGTRTLTSFGTLAADTATAVWAAGTRTLTSAGSLATDVWDVATSGLTTTGSIGKHIIDNITGDIYARLGAPTGASISADIADVSGEIDANEATIAASVVNGLRGDIATVRSPVEEQNVITVRVGDDYLTSYERSFVWQLQNMDSLVGGTASLAVAGVRVSTGSVADGGTDSDGNTIQTVTVEATDAETALLSSVVGSRKPFSVQITVSGILMTTISGYATVLATHPQA